MDDTLVCPVCGLKMRNNNRVGATIFHLIGKEATYVERACVASNHALQLYVDTSTQQVDLIRLSIGPKFTKYVDVDYVNGRTKISCYSASKGKSQMVTLDKIVEPDFPTLEKLEEKISLYVVFS